MSNSKSKIRVCVVTMPLSGLIGGDTFVRRFIRVIEPLCLELYVITGGLPESNDQRIHIRNYALSWDGTRSILYKIFRHLQAQLQISVNLIKMRGSFDVVIFHSGTMLYVVLALIVKAMRKKIIIVHQGSSSKMYQVYKKRWFGIGMLFWWAISLLERSAFYLSDRIVLESNSVMDFVGLDKYRGKIRIGDYYYIDTNISIIKKELKERSNLVGYMGQFHEVKGVMSFAKAIPLIVAKVRDVQFLMIGGGELLDNVKQELEQNGCYDAVTLTGWVSPDEVQDFLSELRVLVLPSISEGLPGSIREAMACGTPVLATPVGGIPDVIKEGETGFILENNSPECIARNVVRALNHPNLEEITRNARALVENEYGYEAVVEKWSTIFASLTPRQAGRLSTGNNLGRTQSQ